MATSKIDQHSKDAPRIGKIISILLDEVVDDPKKNDNKKLQKRVKDLAKLSSKELDNLSAKAKENVADVQRRIDEAVMEKYFVK